MLTVEYDGTNYCGWQKQDNKPTIAGALEKAIEKFSKEQVTVFAAGRTDSGVHALAQVVHLDLQNKSFSSFRVMQAINFYLRKEQIVVTFCEEKDENFHARFSALKRYYQYIILNRNAATVIDKNRLWHIRTKLDLSLMQEAAQLLIGTHDFSSFRAALCQSISPVKTIDSIDINLEGEKILINISAKSFLHHMVRNIVGSLKLVGEKKMTIVDFKAGFVAKNRALMGPTAPAKGLYFIKVDY